MPLVPCCAAERNGLNMTINPRYVLQNLLLKMRYRSELSIPLRTRLEKNTDVYCKTGTIQIGNYSSMRENVHVSALCGGKLILGENTQINRNCILVSRKEIRIGENVFIGPNVCIYDHDHCFDVNGMKEGYTLDDIVIEDNCWIGAGCIILKGTHIGKGSVIGAGCVVKGNIPGHSLVTSNRALEVRALENRSHEKKD